MCIQFKYGAKVRLTESKYYHLSQCRMLYWCGGKFVQFCVCVYSSFDGVSVDKDKRVN